MPNPESYGLNPSDTEPYEEMQRADAERAAENAKYEEWQKAMAEAEELKKAEEAKNTQATNPEKDKNSKKILFKAAIVGLCIAAASSFFAMRKTADKPLPEKPTNTTEQEYHAPSAAQTEEQIQELKKERRIQEAQEDYDKYGINTAQ